MAQLSKKKNVCRVLFGKAEGKRFFLNVGTDGGMLSRPKSFYRIIKKGIKFLLKNFVRQSLLFFNFHFTTVILVFCVNIRYTVDCQFMLSSSVISLVPANTISYVYMKWVKDAHVYF